MRGFHEPMVLTSIGFRVQPHHPNPRVNQYKMGQNAPMLAIEPQSRWIDPTLAQWMAPADTKKPLECTAYGAVFLNRFNHVLRARRGESASAPQQWANRPLVKTDESDKYVCDCVFHDRSRLLSQSRCDAGITQRALWLPA